MQTKKLAAIALTLALATVGGVIARALHLPLGLLLGALLVCGVMAYGNLRIGGLGVTLPAWHRMICVPVIGVSIGATFTPDVARQVPEWWPTILGVMVFIPATQAVGYFIFRKGGLGKLEAFYGAAPGGLIEAVQMGEEAGADGRILTVLQFLRLILTIVAVPFLFLIVTGHSVGSAAGAQMAAGVKTEVKDLALLAATGAIGLWLGHVLKLPGWMMTGPLFLSSALHGLGLVHGAPPAWLVQTVQVVLGAGLGVRFAGIGHDILLRSARLSAVNAVATLALALVFAVAFSQTVDEPFAALFLAFAPGGLAEMSLIALSLGISVIFVTLHHVVRIVLAVMLARMGKRIFG